MWGRVIVRSRRRAAGLHRRSQANRCPQHAVVTERLPFSSADSYVATAQIYVVGQRKVGLPFGSIPLTCPVRALRAWLDVAAIARGPIFRPVDRHANIADTRLTDQSVALVVKRCAKAAGLDWEKCAGHSLRSGLATAAAMADVSERAIMAQTGHKSLPMVRRYIRDGSLFRGEWTDLWGKGRYSKRGVPDFRIQEVGLVRDPRLLT